MTQGRGRGRDAPRLPRRRILGHRRLVLLHILGFGPKRSLQEGRQAGAMAAEPPCATKDPSAQRCPCANPGNPVFSCMLDPKALPSALPGERGRPLAQAQLLLYCTTSSDYGQLPPEPQAAPCRFCPRENAFTNHLLACGRTPSGGINTGINRGRVIDHKDLVNTL